MVAAGGGSTSYKQEMQGSILLYDLGRQPLTLQDALIVFTSCEVIHACVNHMLILVNHHNGVCIQRPGQI